MGSLLNFYKNKTINNTTLFFSPILSHLFSITCTKRSFLNYISNNGFINCYVEDNVVNVDRVYKNCIFVYFTHGSKSLVDPLVFKEEKYSLHDWIISKKNCIDFVETDESICYVIAVSDFNLNFNNILMGNYNEFPEDIFKKYNSNAKVNKGDFHVKYLEYVITKNEFLKLLLMDEFNSRQLTNYHSQFDNALDVYDGTHQIFDFNKSNTIFSKIVKEIEELSKK